MWLWVVLGLIVLVGFVAFTGAPYVPSKRRDVERAFSELYPLDSADVVVDIGSGDGVVLREVSRRGATAIGYEIHPLLVLVSRFVSRHDPKVSVRLANFWRTPLPKEVTAVYTFGDARDIKKMYAKVQQEATRLGKTIAFISYAFDVPGLAFDKTVGAHHLYMVKSLQ